MSRNNHRDDNYSLLADRSNIRRSRISLLLGSCVTFIYRYFVIACCHFSRRHRYCCHNQYQRVDSNEEELSIYPIEEDHDSNHHFSETKRIRDRVIKERLIRHFKSHIQKWIDEKHPQFPWKATLHILLVVLVTAQGCIYVCETHGLTDYLKESTATFKRHFTPDSRLYTLDDIYEQINHTVVAYYDISDQYLITYNYTRDNNAIHNLTMETYWVIGDGDNDGDDENSGFDLKCGERIQLSENHVTEKNWKVTHLYPFTNNETCQTSDCCGHPNNNCTIDCCNCPIKDQVKCYLENLDRIKCFYLTFSLYSTFKRKVIEANNPVNADVDIDIVLDNNFYSGMSVKANIDIELTRHHTAEFRIPSTILDIAVFILLVLSSGTYLYSILLSTKLSKDVKLHFSAFHKKHLRWQEISPLFNKWYVLMLCANCLIFAATILKIISEYKETIVIELVETVRVLLGSGVLLLWCALFGLLKYFESFNVLFITVTLAIPSVLRFLCCAMILFTGFALCGWWVLSPYHPKFKSFGLSLESLFCILNGDDLFVTLEQDHATFKVAGIGLVEVFSKIYLAVFIFIFIYVVLSLFIGIFSHAYESLSNEWKKRSRGFLRDWAEGEPDDDPTKNYPFPIPALRKPVEDTTIAHSCVINPSINASNDDVIPTVPKIEVTKPDDDHPRLRSFSNSTTSNISVKLQVAKPPDASEHEVDEAREKTAHNHVTSDYT